MQLIVQMGDAALGKLPKGIRSDPNAVAETIANNVRRVIIDEYAMNPKYYDKMSELLDDLIKQRQQEALELQGVPGTTDRPGRASRQAGVTTRTYPTWANNGARRALIDFGLTEEQAVAVDQAVMQHQTGPVDRQPHEGTAGTSAPSAACCPMAMNASTSCST